MLHRSRKTKSLRRNKRGAAVRDRDAAAPAGTRAGLPMEGQGGQRGHGEPWPAPWGSEGCGLRGCAGGITDTLRALPPRLDLLIMLTAPVTLSAASWLFPHRPCVLLSVPWL